MSQLSEYRRKVLKLSQEALATQLGYEKWQTYAAQESGRNPIPQEVRDRLEKKFKFKGTWPDEEEKTPAAPAAGTVTREEYEAIRQELWKVVGRLETLERAFERQGEVVRDLVRESEESHRQGRK